MAGVARWLLAIILGVVVGVLPVCAQDPAPASGGEVAPPLVSNDLPRLLELGQTLMGQNNPLFSVDRGKTTLTPEARNAAGEQALRTFQSVVKRYPQSAQGWMWLGITLTRTLRYSKEHPNGEPAATNEQIVEGLDAFRRAFERSPTDVNCVSFYGDALMEFRRDFDAARKIWDGFLPFAKDDIQRVTALTQAARACLNKAYFGKAEGMDAVAIKRYYQDALTYTQRAAKITPKAACVQELQGLLKQYRQYLLGK